MRGKLRDKRVTSKKEGFKSEDVERRRPYRRDSRTTPWLDQQVENEDYDEADGDGEPEEVIEIQIPQKK